MYALAFTGTGLALVTGVGAVVAMLGNPFFGTLSLPVKRVR
jgi:hypothetical protein